MIGWSGRRKTLTILLFIAPTLIGILVFSVFPFVLNMFISLTDRGKFHPNPDCTQAIWRIVEPTCWLGRPPRGLAEPFDFKQPFYQNYVDLLGGLFGGTGLLALLRLAIVAAAHRGGLVPEPPLWAAAHPADSLGRDLAGRDWWAS